LIVAFSVSALELAAVLALAAVVAGADAEVDAAPADVAVTGVDADAEAELVDAVVWLLLHAAASSANTVVETISRMAERLDIGASL
jgi:hypothetical protein